MFVWHHHSLPITQYFSHYLWAPYLSLGADFIFFLQYPNSLNLVEKKKKTLEHEDRISERRTNPKQTKPVKEEEKKKKKRRNPEQIEPVKEEEEEEEEKKNRIANPGEEREKKVKRWSKGAV